MDFLVAEELAGLDRHMLMGSMSRLLGFRKYHAPDVTMYSSLAVSLCSDVPPACTGQ